MRKSGEQQWGQREEEVGGRNKGHFVENTLLGCVETNFYAQDGPHLPRMSHQETKTERTFLFL